MARLYTIIFITTLLAFAAVAQAGSHQQRPISQGPDFSGFDKGRPTFGQLNRREKNQIVLTGKYDQANAKRLEVLLKRKTTSDEKVQNLYKELVKSRYQLEASEKLYRDGIISNEKLRNDYISFASTGELIIHARSQYLSDLKKIYIGNEKKFKRVAEKFDIRRGAWAQKFNEMIRKTRRELDLPDVPLQGIEFKLDHFYNSEGYKEYDDPPKTANTNQQQPAGEPTGEAPDKGPHYQVDDELNRTKIIEKDAAKPEETKTARRQDDKPANKPAPKPTCYGEPDGKWRGGTLARVKQMATDWQRKLSAPCFNDHPGACRQIRGGISFDAYMKILIIWQCHATFVKQRQKNRNEDRITARKEGCVIKKTLDQMAGQIKATRFMNAGAGWKPYHVNMHEKWGLKDFCEPEKIEEASSGSAKEPKPVAEANQNTKKECTGGGLVGAMNCVTKRIEGAGGTGAKTPGRVPNSASSTDKNTSETTTSVKNPDGTRTITKTDKDGNVLSTETVGKGPASASSTDRKTGITTKSVRNPDGTRTVTKTDKDGNILSRERTGKVPDFASATETKTQKTTTSVANPDGSRTVTKTDKDGNVLSTEKVR